MATVRAVLAPLIEAREVATCGIVTLELLYSALEAVDLQVRRLSGTIHEVRSKFTVCNRGSGSEVYCPTIHFARTGFRTQTTRPKIQLEGRNGAARRSDGSYLEWDE